MIGTATQYRALRIAERSASTLCAMTDAIVRYRDHRRFICAGCGLRPLPLGERRCQACLDLEHKRSVEAFELRLRYARLHDEWLAQWEKKP